MSRNLTYKELLPCMKQVDNDNRNNVIGRNLTYKELLLGGVVTLHLISADIGRNLTYEELLPCLQDTPLRTRTPRRSESYL